MPLCGRLDSVATDATIDRMVKLQLRVNPTQTQLILDALSAMATHGGNSTTRLEAGRLWSWLSWRRDKLWGPPGGTAEHATAPEALDRLRDKLTR